MRVPRAVPLILVLIVAALATGLAAVSAANSPLLSRSVTITARTHTVSRGQGLVLHGFYKFERQVHSCPPNAIYCEQLPAPSSPPNPVLYARYGDGKRFWRVKRIEHITRGAILRQVRWWIRVFPTQNVAYRAVARDKSGIWRRAASKPFRVVVTG